jgi:hypothetical protein
MAKGYTPPNNLNIPFKFAQTGYQPPDWNAIAFEFKSKREGLGNLRAAINVMTAEPENYQETTYTYLKYCEEYVIGYSQYGVQILKGKCYYGGVRDLGTSITVWKKPVYSGVKNLIAKAKGVYSGIKDLSADMSGELAIDIQAYVNTLQTTSYDLSASLHGYQVYDLPAYIRSMRTASLAAYLSAVPPVDLPAYLKVWPMKQLPGSIYGWDKLDLGGYTYAIQKGDLPAVIGAIPPKDLGLILRAWVREAVSNLGAYIDGLVYNDLPATVRATYLKDLPAYLGAEPAINLPGFIHGYDTIDLAAILNGVYGSYDLRAQITPTNNFKDLIGILKPRVATEVPHDLYAYIKGVGSSYLNAYINPTPYVNLMAYLNTSGQVADLSARIFPKKIRLTNILSVLTMEHMDLSAVINPSCIWSESRNLTGYVRVIYKSDLGAQIIGKKYAQTIANLTGTVGYADTYAFIDKLPISVSIATDVYRYIDMLPIFIRVFTEETNLTASITGTYLYGDLGASILGLYINPYHFENVKNRQKVSKLDHSGFVEWYEMVELSFKSIVEDYFYSSPGLSAWKVDRLDRWVLDVRSYIPQDLKLNTKRRLHRLKYISDIKRFSSVDEMMRYAIDFVTDYPEINLPAYVKPSGGFKNIQAILNVRRTTQESNNLTSSIVGTPTGTTVVGYYDGIDVI